ncbi:MAG: tetratricopeptide repeat protein [Candidatus Dormibacteria bacterium]
MRHLVPAALAAVALLSAACGIPSGTKPPSAVDSTSPPRPGAATDALIARDQASLKLNPTSNTISASLAGAYLQKVREVGDPSYYGKADELLQAVLKRDPTQLAATVLTGQLQLARHQFLTALDWGQKARALNPYVTPPLAVIVDAEVELGRYPAAIDDVQKMVDLRPDLSSYSRVSYVRELKGDRAGAIEAMQAALTAGGSIPENTAYVQVLLGTLYFNQGDVASAAAQYRLVLVGYPDFVPALAAQAAVAAAKDDLPTAIRLYKKAVDIYPLPQYVIALGDVYAASGDSVNAGRTYDLAAAEQQLYQANGIDLDQELALFDADHQRDSANVRTLAARAVADRPSVTSYDVYSWVLYQAGDFQGALAATRQAHKLGTRDALFYFHTGMIEAKLGMNHEARSDLGAALAINPHFSVLHTPEAQKELAALGGPL